MKKFFLALVSYLLKLQDNSHENKQKKILASSGNGAKTIFTPSAKLEIKNKIIDEMRALVIQQVTPIIKKNIKTPEKILEYIEQSGTPVYKIKNADKILSAIGEQEGFITPLSGMRALYLNYSLKRKITTRTDEMFVLRDLPINIYVMAHQFYKWYGWRIQMPGYDDKTQDIFKKIWLFGRDEDIKKLTYDELANVKEAIARDKEAINFVIKLAQENDGAKKGFDNLKDGGTDI